MADDQGRPARVGPPILPEFLRSVYANQININFTPHDFRVVFSMLEVPVEPPPESADGEVELRPTATASVIVPATVMHAFIGVLQESFGKYLEQFGPPGLDPKGPGA